MQYETELVLGDSSKLIQLQPNSATLLLVLLTSSLGIITCDDDPFAYDDYLFFD